MGCRRCMQQWFTTVGVATVLFCSYAAGARLFETGRSIRDGWSFRRRVVLDDVQLVPARGTCRLSWYTAQTPKFGNTVVCSGPSTEDCLEPCSAGYERLHNSSLCLQKCPDEAAGPAHMCAISRTCIKAEGVCPMLADVPFYCPVPDQFLGSCAKQSYQALTATHKTEHPCAGTLYKDYTGKWRCSHAVMHEPCSAGFANITSVTAGVGTRCMQMCPPWLVDCGETCHMPGVPCSQPSDVLCPVALTTACSLTERSTAALQAACQQEGFRTVSGCPLGLSMHGSCGGAKLQVTAGLRSKGFLRKVEAWWGPVAGAEPLPDNFDGPLRAVRLTFSDHKEPVVFGNTSHTLVSLPRMTFKMNPNELVIGTNLWSSSSVMDGTYLTPMLAGFSIFTTSKNTWQAGGMTDWEGKMGTAKIGAALSNWDQHLALSGTNLGVGLPVGAAAYTGDSGIHAFGLLFLSGVVKQEL